MGKPKVKIKPSAAREILRGPEVEADIQRRVDSIQDGCGEGFVADVQVGRNRVHGRVKTTDFQSRRRNSRDNTLLKALGRGR